MNYIETETQKISDVIKNAKNEQRMLSEDEYQAIICSLERISRQEKTLVEDFDYDEKCLKNFESIVESVSTLLKATDDTEQLTELAIKMKDLADEVVSLEK